MRVLQINLIMNYDKNFFLFDICVFAAYYTTITLN